MESLSEDEFHRMQMQILELRTENYQLKDENKKLSFNLSKSSENEAKLGKEVAKQTKLRKAFTTLNKSKQAQEFEELLQQNEQAFVLQNQTLAEELSKLQTTVKTLENENRQFKRQISLAPQDKAREAEMRKLQASNSALTQSLAALRNSQPSEPVGKTPTEDTPSSEIMSEQHVNGSLDQSPQKERPHNSSADTHSRPGPASEEDSKYFGDLEVQVLTLQEEKRLLEFELDNTGKKHDAKIAEMSEAMSALQTKLDQKQKSYNNVHKDMTLLQEFKKGAVETAAKLTQENEHLKSELERSSSDCQSLHKALQETHNIVEQQQKSLLHWQQQVDLKEEEYKSLKSEFTQNSERLDAKTKELDRIVGKLDSLEREKDDAKARSEKSANAGEALLNKYTDLERKCEGLVHELQQSQSLAEQLKKKLEGTKALESKIEELKNELREALDLAEKRKQTADQQSVEAQDHMTKLNLKMETLQSSNEEKFKSMTEKYEEKVGKLERVNKSQEEELIRTHHQERLKTREIDSLQQKINDLTATNTSLENSKGWFERALHDAEELAGKTKEEHAEKMEKMREEQDAELEKAAAKVREKEEAVEAAEMRVEEARGEVEKRERDIERLKCDVKDEVQKQKLVEKKVHSTLKDLKKQLNTERKKNEMLQEKIKEQSSGKTNLDELLSVVNTSNSSKPSSGGADGASSISSFSFRDLINPGKSAPPERHFTPTHQRTSSNTSAPPASQLTANETTDLLSRITELQNEKWDLEEKVRHLEESAGAMADELLEKTAVVQQFVGHSRTDRVKRAPPEDQTTPKTLKDKVRSFVTGTEDPSPSGIGNVYELNKKLTRMLEEEMTKNIALKKDMEIMAKELSAR